MIAGYVLIAAGALCAFAALVLFVDARRHDPRPPFAGPNQFTPAPQEAAGPLPPFPAPPPDEERFPHLARQWADDTGSLIKFVEEGE